jgi:hypothetical protein
MAALLACNGDDPDDEVVAGCRDGSPDPGITRYGVVSHPYDEDANQTDLWEVVSLDPGGELARTEQTFRMGRAALGTVAFTNDGSLGFAVQDDGTIGVFGLEESGTPTVVDPGWNDQGAVYAVSLTLHPGGELAWVLDGDTVEQGGGIYEVHIDCTDGTLSNYGRITASTHPSHLLPVGDGTHHVLLGEDVLESAAGEHAHLIDMEGPTRLGSASIWPDDEAIVGGAAVAGDGAYVLAGDFNMFSGLPNRVAVVWARPDGVQGLQVLSPIEDPVSIATWGQATLVVSGTGDELLTLDYDPGNSQAPFSIGAPLAYADASPLLPSSATAVAGPSGAGWILVAELSSVRTVQARSDGTQVDQGTLAFGSGFENMVGAMGMQP